MKKKIAIFASGSGTNFEALAAACENNLIDAEISLLICDNPMLNTVLFKSNSQLPVSPEMIVIKNNTNLQKIHFEGNSAVTTSTILVEGNFRLFVSE